MATSKKLSVIKTAPPNPALYSFWGNQAGAAMQQGWYPAVPTSEFTVYRQPYTSAFNDVFDPKTQQKGRLAIIGKKGNKMDIVIEGADGNIIHTINQNVSPDFVQNYLTNNKGVVAERMDNIANKRIDSIVMNR